MEKAGGYAMLFGLVLIAIGVWRAVAGTEDAIAAVATGTVILLAGFGMVNWPGSTPVQTVAIEDPEGPPTPEEPTTAWFSVIESVEEEVLEQVASVLQTDPRITHISHESGRYYSNPDRDDLPECFALRCECNSADVDQVMADAARTIAERLGQAARDRVQIRRY